MRQLFLTDEQLWRAIAENTTELSNPMDREVETPGNWRGANKAGPIQQIAAAVSGLYCRTSPSLFVSDWWPRCHGCGGSICLSDRVYEPLLSDVGNALDEIESAPPSFVSAHYRPAV